MKIITHEQKHVKIAEITSESILIIKQEEGLELLMNIYYQDFDRLILHKKNITPLFFDLRNGMAGEILQKFSNYRVKLAIVGDFSEYTNNSIQDFMKESNRVGQVNFVRSVTEAIKELSK